MTPQTQKLERILSEAELKEAVARAEAFRAHDEFLKDGERYRTALKQLGSPEGVSVSRAYQIAQELDIPRDYFQRALAMSPSREEKLEQLKVIGAEPNSDDLAEYAGLNFIHIMGDALMKGLPSEETYAMVNLCVNGRVCTQMGILKEKKRILRKPTKEKKILAQASLWSVKTDYSGNGEIHIYSPLFITACGEALTNFEKGFGTFEKRIEYKILT